MKYKPKENFFTIEVLSLIMPTEDEIQNGKEIIIEYKYSFNNVINKEKLSKIEENFLGDPTSDKILKPNYLVEVSESNVPNVFIINKFNGQSIMTKKNLDEFYILN